MKNDRRLLANIGNISWIIFGAFLVVRLGFAYLSGYDNFELLADTARYNAQSDNILKGNLNLTTYLFVTAPVYPYFEALFKLLFRSYWIPILQLAQIIISSLSGVYLYKTAKLIWSNHIIALITAALYCFFPLTLWWVHTFSQETLFQSLLIFTIFVFLKAIYEHNIYYLVISAIFFSFTFLTKSHILLFSPFIPLIILFSNNQNLKQKILYIVVFTSICFISTLPYGLYNLKVNGLYVLSSTGQGAHFLIGHNDDAYLIIAHPPPRNSAEWEHLSKDNLRILDQLAPMTEGLTESQRQKLYFVEGVKWCLANPQKALEVAFYDLYHFLMPGVNPNWYPTKQWLLSLLISLPIYIFGYTGIFIALKQNFSRHSWILGLIGSMIIFSVGFYVQNRFRTITLEPFYILYSSFGVTRLWEYAQNRRLNSVKNIPGL